MALYKTFDIKPDLESFKCAYLSSSSISFQPLNFSANLSHLFLNIFILFSSLYLSFKTLYLGILLTWTINFFPNPCLSLMWFSRCDNSSDIVTKVTWDYINNCVNNFEAKMRWPSLIWMLFWSIHTGYMDAVIILCNLSAKFKNEIVGISYHYQAF